MSSVPAAKAALMSATALPPRPSWSNCDRDEDQIETADEQFGGTDEAHDTSWGWCGRHIDRAAPRVVDDEGDRERRGKTVVAGAPELSPAP